MITFQEKGIQKYIISFYFLQILVTDRDSKNSRSNKDFCDFVSKKNQDKCQNGHCFSQFFDNKVPWLGHVKRIYNSVGV